MAEKAKHKERDLTQSEPDPIDSPNPPTQPTGEAQELKLGIILPVACVLLVAIVAHRLLGMSGGNSLFSGFAVVVGVSYPQYATTMLQHMSNLARKFRNK
jgi:hypothetical protein